MERPRTFRLRIGRVRLKGGAELRVLRPAPKATGLAHRALADDVAFLRERYAPEEMVGYALVVWDDKGRYSPQLVVEKGSPIPASLVPSWLRDCFVRYLAECDVTDPPEGPTPAA